MGPLGRLAAVLAVVLLAACGGGGGSDAPATTSEVVSGTVATAKALAYAEITAKCSSGAPVTTTATVTGTYSLTIPSAQFPCLLEAQSSSPPLVMYSIALESGVANLTPLSSMVVGRIAGLPTADAFGMFPSATLSARVSAAALNGAQAAVRSALVGTVDLSSIPDLVKSPFTAATATQTGDAQGRLLEETATALVARKTSAPAVELLLARGEDPAAVKAALDAGAVNAHRVPIVWKQQSRTGGGWQMGKIGSDIYVSGGASGQILTSKDLGETWGPMWVPGGRVFLEFKGRILAFPDSFKTANSADGGRTWSTVVSLPGIPDEAKLFVNTVRRVSVSNDRVFAYYGTDLGDDVPLAWNSTDGVTFVRATAEEVAAFEANEPELAGGYEGVVPPPLPNLMWLPQGQSAPVYFRAQYEENPDYAAGVSKRYWNYYHETSLDGIAWHPVNLTPNYSISHVSEVAPGRLIAAANKVGEREFESIYVTLLSTDSGRTWRSVGGVDDPRRQWLNSAASVGGALLAVGEEGLIRRSVDGGSTWTTVVAPTSEPLRHVAGNGTTLVAVGAAGTLLVSTDAGQTWSSQTTGTQSNLSAIAWGQGRFVVAAADGSVLTSADGLSWARTGSGLPVTSGLTSNGSMAFGEGAFVAAFGVPICVGASCESGSGGVFRSTDGGQTWARSYGNGANIAFGAGHFMMVSGYDSLTTVSGDGGQAWTRLGRTPVGFGSFGYGDGFFAMSSPTDGLYASFDLGLTWSQINVAGGLGFKLFYVNGKWVSVGGWGLNRVLAVTP